jgi:hypothetical protein
MSWWWLVKHLLGSDRDRRRMKDVVLDDAIWMMDDVDVIHKRLEIVPD